MKITGVEIIPFRVKRPGFRNGKLLPEVTARQTLTRILTDEGAEGLYLGGHGHGDQDGLSPEECAQVRSVVERLLVGQDPLDRERFWHWMWVANLPEHILSTIDLTLWDLAARAAGLPVFKYAGGCRHRVLAYASTYPNMGMPEDYARHALDCLERGYTAYKIHPYYFWDPETQQPDPGRPSHVAWDVRVCEAVRDAVGDAMVLMYDPWGTYRTYEEALYIGRVLEELEFYWYEHPMPEYRVESYVRLSRELEIPVLSPEIAAGSIYTRADWILRGASDMSRMDVLRGGMTGMLKMAAICEAFGQKCEVHMSGFGNLQVLGATSEDVCEYYERGLEAPGLDYDVTPPYLEAPSDPLDEDGYVPLPQEPGMGYRLNWDYIQDNRIEH
ncbi:MAG: enolase [Anaerolineae bacterium]|nr:enolase [Anaerolineae bacterium]